MPTQLNEIEWETSCQFGRQKALRRGKTLLVYFSGAPECRDSAEFEDEALHDPEVVGFVEKYFQPVKLHPKRDAQLVEKFHIRTTPTLVIVDQQNAVQHIVEGKLPAHDLLGQLSLGLGKLWLDNEWFEKSKKRLEQVIAKHAGSTASDEAKYWKLVVQKRQEDGLIEEAVEESFPASDPPCWTLGRNKDE